MDDDGISVRRIVVASIGCVALSACYPALKVMRPRVDLTVRDVSGAAVADATFTIATYRYPFPSARSMSLASYQTERSGVLKLRKRRDWLWQVLLPDGVRWYDWAYCVEKPGYRAVAAVEPDFGEPITVVLEPFPRPSNCDWPTAEEPYYEVEVVEG
jgi:hypothetical protein